MAYPRHCVQITVHVLITDGLASQIENLDNYDNLQILNVKGNPRDILRLSRSDVNEMRNKMLKPLGINFDAPTMVSMYLIGEDLFIIENFKDEAVSVTLETEFSMNPGIELVLPATETVEKEFNDKKLEFLTLPPRTLVAISY